MDDFSENGAKIKSKQKIFRVFNKEKKIGTKKITKRGPKRGTKEKKITKKIEKRWKVAKTSRKGKKEKKILSKKRRNDNFRKSNHAKSNSAKQFRLIHEKTLTSTLKNITDLLCNIANSQAQYLSVILNLHSTPSSSLSPSSSSSSSLSSPLSTSLMPSGTLTESSRDYSKPCTVMEANSEYERAQKSQCDASMTKLTL